jgi:hypothetical protein
VVLGPRAARIGSAVAAIPSSFRDDAYQLFELVGLCARFYGALSLG